MSAGRVRFERNTIRQAFCELRFPTLPDLATDAPREFVKGIRHTFPRHEHAVDVAFGITAQGFEHVPRPTHRFRSADGAWMCWLRTQSLGLETTRYEDFEALASRLEVVMEAARPALDTDFFTRVGLRYINIVPATLEQIHAEPWLNQALLDGLESNPLGRIERAWSETRGHTAEGSYTFRHGAVPVDGEGPRYVLDADFAAESVEWDDVIPLLHRFREHNFRLYDWAIGPRTRDYLGPPVTSEE